MSAGLAPSLWLHWSSCLCWEQDLVTIQLQLEPKLWNTVLFSLQAKMLCTLQAQPTHFPWVSLPPNSQEEQRGWVNNTRLTCISYPTLSLNLGKADWGLQQRKARKIQQISDTKTNQGWAHQELPTVNRVRLIKSLPWTYHSLIQQAVWPCKVIRRLFSSQNSTQEWQPHSESRLGLHTCRNDWKAWKVTCQLRKGSISMCHSLQHRVFNKRIHLSSSLSPKSFFIKAELKNKLDRRTISISCWSFHVILHCYIFS